ncbi:MAG: threonine/serine dehydratase [Hyphomicrobiaceae bacterium]|nr:threonine/serine dehydratase [Hyphomicrobiaceae bacterium]
MSLRLPTIEDIRAAHERLKPHLVATPLLEHPALNEKAGGRVLVKCENLQRVGAFKFRGAYNKIVQVDRAMFPGGVVACSSGNHAQGVAAAATLLGVTSAIVMPADAPAMKVARTRAFGGEVVPYDRVGEDREAIAARLCAERGAAMVHPFDDWQVMSGQGTVGLEIVTQAAAVGATPDAVLVACSGGGLAGGIGLAVKASVPKAEILTVEPEGFDDMARSLRSGRRERNDKLSGSICDALLAETPGETTFAVAKSVLAGGLVVSDEEVRAAIRFAFADLKLVIEPGGAAALAAILAGRLATKGRTTVVVVSGGNIDAGMLCSILGAA